MLSRLSTKSIISPKHFFGITAVPNRYSSDAPPVIETKNEKKFIETSYTDFDATQSVTVLNKDHVPLPYPFEGPERDLVNFPKLVRRETNAPTRHLVFPEGWFKTLYPKLGVSGPYTLTFGLFTYLVSKEILITNDTEFKHFVALLAWVYILARSPLGKKFVDIEYDGYKEQVEEYKKWREQLIKDRFDAVEHEKKEQWRQEGKKLLYQAKREAVALQLEAAYRHNVKSLYDQVKKRLDYQVEVGKIENRVKQQFMVQWVIEKVQEAIANQSEKDTIKKCIADLNTLAARV